MSHPRIPYVAIAASLLLFIATLTPAIAATYTIDPDHSVVVFKINHFGVSNFMGRFNETSGTFNFDPENPQGASLDVTIKAESLDTAAAKRDQHLRGPDFFNAKQFPVITLKSKKIEKAGDDKFHVTAELMLHGVKKEIEFDVHFVGSGDDPWGNYRAGFESTFVVKRGEFGMNYMPEGLGNDVTLMVSVEGIRK